MSNESFCQNYASWWMPILPAVLLSTPKRLTEALTSAWTETFRRQSCSKSWKWSEYSCTSDGDCTKDFGVLGPFLHQYLPTNNVAWSGGAFILIKQKGKMEILQQLGAQRANTAIKILLNTKCSVTYLSIFDRWRATWVWYGWIEDTFLLLEHNGLIGQWGSGPKPGEATLMLILQAIPWANSQIESEQSSV